MEAQQAVKPRISYAAFVSQQKPQDQRGTLAWAIDR